MASVYIRLVDRCLILSGKLSFKLLLIVTFLVLKGQFLVLIMLKFYVHLLYYLHFLTIG